MDPASSIDGSAPSPLRQIDLVADRFEQEWRLGGIPRISDYLDGVPDEQRLLLLAELVCVDLEQRLRKRLSVTLQDYFRDFPELESLPPVERAGLETHARQRFDELRPTVGAGPGCPQRIGRYTIAGHLGSGGQADVFLSFHPELLVPVVVKWRSGQRATEDGRREEVVREGRILASLAPHPNLVRVYDLGFHEGRPFLVVEYVSGRSLEQYARDERPAPARAAELVALLAQGAGAAHEQGAIHQDINPSNAILDGLGEPRLIDFGLAWFRSAWADPSIDTRPDGGTPQFISPEQADPRVGPIDRRTDVFGLGAVLYFLLTGRPLYKGTTLAEILRQAGAAEYDASALDRGGIPTRLAAICRKALSCNPEARFATARELAMTLRSAVRRPRWHGVVVVALLFLAAVGGGWLLGRPARHAPGSVVEERKPALEVQVWRPKTRYAPLSVAVPVRTGDELQIRLRVPAGLHIGLFSVNGHGRLSLLQQYPPQDAATTLVFPACDHAKRLEAPAGTEVLLVCGRRERAVGESDLEAVWDRTVAWPRLDPPRRLLRLHPGRVSEEGELSRDLGATSYRPDGDGVVRKLDKLRDRLRPMCPFFEGLAFAHE